MTGAGMAGAGGLGADDAEARMLRLRAWRRGMRELDLLLGPYADAELAGMDAAGRTAFAALLEVPDQDVFAWIVAASRGEVAAPAEHAPLVARLAAGAAARVAGSRQS